MTEIHIIILLPKKHKTKNMLSNFENKIRMKLLKKARNIRKKVLDINELNESNKNDYDDVFAFRDL